VTVLCTASVARGAAEARRLQGVARRYLRAVGRADAELSLLVTGDAGIRRLNRRWRGKDRATDVLSFPLSDPAGSGSLLGDVVLSVDTAVRRGGGVARAVRLELDRYLAHGLLHLLGYDHERRTDAAAMAAAEEKLVRGTGMVRAALGAKEIGRRASRRRPEKG
jgi:probable rRNA maturation factor